MSVSPVADVVAPVVTAVRRRGRRADVVVPVGPGPVCWAPARPGGCGAQPEHGVARRPGGRPCSRRWCPRRGRRGAAGRRTGRPGGPGDRRQRVRSPAAPPRSRRRCWPRGRPTAAAGVGAALAEPAQPAAVGCRRGAARDVLRGTTTSRRAGAWALGEQRGHGGDAGQALARLGRAGAADQGDQVGRAGERARLRLGGVQAGQAGLEQGARARRCRRRWCRSPPGTARRPTRPLGRRTTLSGVRPPTASPTRCASATPSARRRRTVRTSRSGIGPRVSRSASVSPSIHSLTT